MATLPLASLAKPLNNEHVYTKRETDKERERERTEGGGEKARVVAMAARFDAYKGIGFKSVESADKGERGTEEEGIVRGGNDDDGGGGGGSSRECRAAFWVSGFVPRPLTSVHPRNSPSLPPALPPPPPLRPRTKFGKAAVRAAHECGTVGQRTP